LPRMLSGQPAERARTVLAARTTRWLLLCGSLALGLGLAFGTYHLSAQWGGSGRPIPQFNFPPTSETMVFGGCGADRSEPRGGGVRPRARRAVVGVGRPSARVLLGH